MPQSGPFVEICNLSYRYPSLRTGSVSTHALRDVSLSIEPGECVAVTGPNGCGLTTLCLATSGLIPHLSEGVLEGTIRVAGHNVQSEPPGALAGLMGLVMQDPLGQLFNTSVEEEVAWGLGNLGVPRDEMEERVGWALRVTGLQDVPRTQPPHALSGGQQKRLALAAALALQPRLLILDKPAGGLTPRGHAEMVAVLRNLRHDGGLAILLAENDSRLIAEMADRVFVLDAGQVVSQGSPRAVYTQTPDLAERGLSLPPAAAFTKEVNTHSDLNLSAFTDAEVLAQTGSYALKPEGVGAPQSPAGLGTGSVEVAVTVRQLRFAYPQGAPVLQGIDLAIPSGQLATLMGDNGAGKTTLARHLIGLLRPQSGEILLFGRTVSGRSIGELAREVGFAFQNPELQIFSPTVREEIAFGPRNLDMSEAQVDQYVQDALDSFALTDLADLPPAGLTFSTRRLVALASIAAMHTPLIVLDEPTVGLDETGRQQVLTWMRKRHAEGATILLITHDTEFAAACAERVIVMQHGRIIVDGAPLQVFADQATLQKAGLVPPFALRFADGQGRPTHALTPEAAAHEWLELRQ